MITEKIHLGHSGEEAAVSYLKSQGYQILERNFRNKIGEIDIVASQEDTLVFIEVKTRNSDMFGSPFESVTPAKQRKIARVALSYLKFYNKNEAKARFDVVAVQMEGNRCESVKVIQNAFEVQ